MSKYCFLGLLLIIPLNPLLFGCTHQTNDHELQEAYEKYHQVLQEIELGLHSDFTRELSQVAMGPAFERAKTALTKKQNLYSELRSEEKEIGKFAVIKHNGDTAIIAAQVYYQGFHIDFRYWTESILGG